MAVVGCGEKCPGTVVWAPEERGLEKVKAFCSSVVVADARVKKRDVDYRAKAENPDQELVEKLVLMHLNFTSIALQFRNGSRHEANRWSWSLDFYNLTHRSHELIVWENGSIHNQVKGTDPKNLVITLINKHDAQIQKITLVCLSCIKKSVLHFFTHDYPVFSQALPITIIGEYVMHEPEHPGIPPQPRYLRSVKRTPAERTDAKALLQQKMTELGLEMWRDES